MRAYKTLLFILLVMCVGIVSAQEEGDEILGLTEEAMPRLPEMPEPIDDHGFNPDTVIIPCGKGVVITSDAHDFLSVNQLCSICGVHFENIAIPGNEKRLSSQLYKLVVGQCITQETLFDIRDAIQSHYSKCSCPFVIVDIPEQDISCGVIQVVVKEAVIGKVCVQGNKYTSSERLINYLRVYEDQTINERRVFSDLNFINRNPFRRADVIYAPGEAFGTTDVTLAVNDRRPFRVYAGTENSGVATTGRGRWFTGFNWGNAFGLDHIFSFQYTSAFNLHRYQAYAGEYLAPLPWKHVLDLYGGYATVHPKVLAPIRRNSGWSLQGSMRYIVPLPIYHYLEQEATIGFDFKRTNNTFEFTGEVPRFGNNVNLTQLVFGYGGNYERDTFRLDFDGSLFWSPGKWLADQTNADYASLRRDAKNQWVYFNGFFTYLQKLPADFSNFINVRGQISSQNLLPSEQLAIGGFNTVRGYDQNQLTQDSGIIANWEFRSPAFAFISAGRPASRVDDALQLLAFVDYGWGSDHNPDLGTPKTDYLLSAGPGMRYTFEPYLTIRLDWGFKLHKQDFYGGGNSMVNFSVVLSY